MANYGNTIQYLVNGEKWHEVKIIIIHSDMYRYLKHHHQNYRFMKQLNIWRSAAAHRTLLWSCNVSSYALYTRSRYIDTSYNVISCVGQRHLQRQQRSPHYFVFLTLSIETNYKWSSRSFEGAATSENGRKFEWMTDCRIVAAKESLSSRLQSPGWPDDRLQ